MAKNNDIETTDEDGFEAAPDTAGERPVVTDEARELAMDLARALFIGMHKSEDSENLDPRSSEFKEKWAAERPKMLKLSRFVLRRLFGRGYQFSSTGKSS